MTTDTITHGETYDIEVAAQDANNDPIVLDGTWSVACRITKGRVGGPVIAEPTLTIAAGVATGSIDTGDSPWTPGTYYYDIRLTDADGNDQWSEPQQLVLNARNTPNT